MPIKEGYVTELQALNIASKHCGKNVCKKTVTNLRKVLGAIKTERGKYIYPCDAVEDRWPRGVVRSDRNSVPEGIKFTHKGGCGELHFHNCEVTINIVK